MIAELALRRLSSAFCLIWLAAGPGKMTDRPTGSSARPAIVRNAEMELVTTI